MALGPYEIKRWNVHDKGPGEEQAHGRIWLAGAGTRSDMVGYHQPEIPLTDMDSKLKLWIPAPNNLEQATEFRHRTYPQNWHILEYHLCTARKLTAS